MDGSSGCGCIGCLGMLLLIALVMFSVFIGLPLTAIIIGLMCWPHHRGFGVAFLIAGTIGLVPYLMQAVGSVEMSGIDPKIILAAMMPAMAASLSLVISKAAYRPELRTAVVLAAVLFFFDIAAGILVLTAL